MADEPFRKLDWDELGIVRPANGPVPKAVVREAVRVAIQPHVKALVEAQVAQAVGIKYLMARDADGKFKRVVSETPEDLDALIADGGTILEVWTKDPSTPAFTDLMNRAIDKPKEQEVEVKITGSDELLARLDAWKMAHRVLEREDEREVTH